MWTWVRDALESCVDGLVLARDESLLKHYPEQNMNQKHLNELGPQKKQQLFFIDLWLLCTVIYCRGQLTAVQCQKKIIQSGVLGAELFSEHGWSSKKASQKNRCSECKD